ncbi:hypothetical protein LSAT2_023486, partial [Lamellibrachia satsuma]
LNTFLEQNATGNHLLLEGESPFPDEFIERDDVLDSLLHDACDDVLAVQLTEVLCLAIKNLLMKMVQDQLPGGKYFDATEEIRNSTVSVPMHNKLPEFIFGVLDHLMKIRPNATILSNEAFLLYSHNRTSEWLASLNRTEKDKMLTEARQASRKTKREFLKRRKIIVEKRHLALVKKQEELEKKRANILKEKERLTDKIVYYGLWQSSHEVTSKVAELVGKEKLDALQAQIRFRQKVLKQNHDDNSVFAFSAKDDTG